MQHKILILGGTKEAAELAVELVQQGHDVTTSLAGRTKEPEPLAGKTRIGGFGGAMGLAIWLQENNITKLFDLTHPFAEQISRNAVDAVGIACIPLEIRHRAPWEKQANDSWIEVPSLVEAAKAIPKDARVFLALGSQYLTPFQHRNDVHFTIRMVDQPLAPLPFEQHNIILGKPSKEWNLEAELMTQEAITHIVCRNSGGSGGYAKIVAARSLHLPVILIGRPK
ncbi:MAG: cobalt-precorrin-6A reductase [Rhizobiaceae bacterium]